uniref:fatty-acid amide hydrolase 1-like n=1 Tax=Styela clava TaxID=7725 RepID=UPI001939E80B|nr:fatty-acid amide hydrolase 1-like [Styela clava]
MIFEIPSQCVPCMLLALVVLICAKLLQYVAHIGRSKSLRDRATKKREKEQAFIQRQLGTICKELSEEKVKSVLSLNGPQLVDEIKGKQLSPSLATKIYVYNACKVTKKLNCITEIIKDYAETAEKLEAKNATDLPLYGLPVSIKECLETKGAPSTVGIASYLDNIATSDCVLAQVLKHCGAVPFAKTNFSQMILSFESSNPIFGETSNPRNPDFGPGGSSSGEGSIVGSGASVLGFGTDTGGSIRGPSHLCGICGFKPTLNRLSHSGLVPPYCMTSVTATVGPMARDVDTIVMAMRALCCDKMFELDPHVIPVKFRDEMYNNKKPLRIGYFYDNGYVKPVPACQRVVKMAKEALEKAGHTLVSYTVPDIEDIMDAASTGLWTMPWIVRKIYAFLLSLKSPRMAKDLMAYGGGGDTSTYNLWQVRMKIEMYKAKFWSEWREKYKIDAVICPTYPLVACKKGNLVNTTGLMTYTVLFNTVNGPAGTVPVSKVTQKDIDDLKDFQGHYGDDWDEHNKKATLQSINMPIGVQCASYPFKEEVCLRLMKEVETLLPMKKDQ